MGRQELGKRGEEAAAAYLERVGMTVVDRNWRCKAGEIDLVCLEGQEVVFVEVKTRKTTATGQPEEAVTPTKQRRYKRLAQAYLQEAGLTEIGVRFDVISLLVIADDRALLRHYRAAFIPE